MNGWEKIASVLMPPLIWMGSVEWRLRNKVGNDRFGDLKEYLDQRFNSLETKIDKINGEDKHD